MELEALSVHLELPDLWQQAAVRHLKEGKDVILDAPTGAGKTFVFELLVRSGALKGQAVYTVPTRALANDKWREWKQADWKVGISTGDRTIDAGAPVLVATLETQRERVLRGEGPALLVIDEYQMIADERRGLNYELAIALAPSNTQLLLMSGSVANPTEIEDWLRDLGRDPELVSTKERPVPLDDYPLQALPSQAPSSLKGFWPRLAHAAIQSDCAPLLIFAPQRKAAEKIARQISDALPQSQPIPLTQAQKQVLGSPLEKLVTNRVAFHHSGLSYAQRAGLIEPLAKAGQFRVIVATTGLAAGINFSVRSVFIGDTQYFEGPFQRQIQPDELLQMFGRAGRRGLDEIGYVLSADRSPRLSDAHPRHLRRSNQIDWPTLLRIMKQARDDERSPFESARELCTRLFSRQTISLGFGRNPSSPASSPRADENLFDLGPTRKEWLDSEDQWAEESSFVAGEVSLSELWVRQENRGWRPALQCGPFLQEHVRKLGRLCRQKGNPEQPYAVDITLAQRGPGDLFRLTRKWRRELPREGFEGSATPDAFRPPLQTHLDTAYPGVRIARLEVHGEQLHALLDISAQKLDAHRDPHGKWILRPESRLTRIEVSTSYVDEETGRPLDPEPGSAAHAWRKLNLIEPDGSPTIRGQIFSFFHQGEGLAIAAALEDESYPVEELVVHLANLRAGHRFALDQDERWPSERLGWSCRQAFGAVDHPGYLRLGLPDGYGDGAAEVVSARLSGKSGGKRASRGTYGNGDVERATVEWFSLLRHLVEAPDLEWARWQDLKTAARELLTTHRRSREELPPLPELDSHILDREIRHRFTLKPPRN